MASRMRLTPRATSWVAWQIGPLKAKTVNEVADNNTTEITEVGQTGDGRYG